MITDTAAREVVFGYETAQIFENTEIQNISILRVIREKKKPIYSITNSGAKLYTVAPI